MPFSDQERERIVNRINERAPRLSACPGCGTDNWALMSGAFFVPIQELPPSGQVAPLIGAVCPVCGYTHMFNLLILGLEDVVKKLQGL